MVNNQQKSRSGASDKYAIEIQTRYARITEHVEDPASDNCSDDPEQNVEHNAFAVMIDQVTRDEASH